MKEKTVLADTGGGNPLQLAARILQEIMRLRADRSEEFMSGFVSGFISGFGTSAGNIAGSPDPKNAAKMAKETARCMEALCDSCGKKNQN